ncbi:hypothetical protein [Citrobacter farmeri]|uniref:hypothetical protein n=1 Tax=Citrobacter farmeri TaxID=67824 RepID=UPI00189EB8A5|nr:hypothetical protein [Citrobacter farmeri]
MSNIEKRELLGAQKHANQHRLSRLTMEVHTDELRIMASAVEGYTNELIAALEAAEKRIAELRDWNLGLAQESFTYQQRVKGLNGIILSARQFISEYAESGDAGADEFVKVIDCAAGIGKGE